jgi:ArsR family transcriptional regulator
MKPKCCQNKESTAELSKTVEFLKVVAEENRLKILCMLRVGEKCVCDIWQFLDLPQNLASHHLKVLKDFGLVEDRKEGLRVYYSVNKKEINKYNSLLNKFLQSYER